MEHAESEEECLVFLFLVGLGALEVILGELGECTTQVGLQVLGSFIGYLDGVLENGFWDDFYTGEHEGLG